jgi:hypothetical protein
MSTVIQRRVGGLFADIAVVSLPGPLTADHAGSISSPRGFNLRNLEEWLIRPITLSEQLTTIDVRLSPVRGMTD